MRRCRLNIGTASELAYLGPDLIELWRLLALTVIDGRFGGVEVAAVRKVYFRLRWRSKYRSIDPLHILLVLVHFGSALHPELGPSTLIAVATS